MRSLAVRERGELNVRAAPGAGDTTTFNQEFRHHGGMSPRGRRARWGSRTEDTLASVTVAELLEAGVHFGHQTKRWNPKMKKYIFAERNGIHIFDLNKTLTQVEVA